VVEELVGLGAADSVILGEIDSVGLAVIDSVGSVIAGGANVNVTGEPKSYPGILVASWPSMKTLTTTVPATSLDT